MNAKQTRKCSATVKQLTKDIFELQRMAEEERARMEALVGRCGSARAMVRNEERAQQMDSNWVDLHHVADMLSEARDLLQRVADTNAVFNAQ